MEQLIFKGETEKISGFIRADGSKLNGSLSFNKEFGLIVV